MWKPGTAKPNDAPPKSQKTSIKADGGVSSAKKLSTSTMGMRFMQRKNEAKQEQEDRKAAMQAAAARKNNRNHATTDTSGVAGSMSDSGNIDRKREVEEISKDHPASDGEIILEIASVVDIYGVGSDIVGRRSFGGFHKSVKTTWEAALKSRTDEEARTRNTKSHITDEELLERYEKYVKGRGGEAGGSGKQGRKDKRKRN